METVTVKLRNSMIFDGRRYRRRSVLEVPVQVAEHLIEVKKARLVEAHA